MSLRERFRQWSEPMYFLGQNWITLTGAVMTTSTALTTIAFWFYDVFLAGTAASLRGPSCLTSSCPAFLSSACF
jgi:hypothetical protein